LRKKGSLALAALAVASIVFAAVGGTSQAAHKATVKVGLVTDIGSLQDHGFNQLANSGRLEAQAKLHVQTRLYQTATAADRLPNLQAAAQQGNGLVIGTGFFMGDPINRLASTFPNTKFAGIDVNWTTDLASHPPNVRGLIFKEQQAGYLAGYIAGLVVKNKGGPQVISSVGANAVPAIIRYQAGYRAGAKKADPKITVLNELANDPTFSDQAKCKETATGQIARHTQVIFAVAGLCGIGALNAAKENHLWGVGVDADQGYLGSFMLTSAVKRVDVATFLTIKAYKKNPSGFKGGFNKVFDLKNGGVGYGKIAKSVPHRAAIIKAVTKIEKLIASGKIVPPTK
jgi:basic membrane protein A and related proteins